MIHLEYCRLSVPSDVIFPATTYHGRWTWMEVFRAASRMHRQTPRSESGLPHTGAAESGSFCLLVTKWLDIEVVCPMDTREALLGGFEMETEIGKEAGKEA